MPNPDNGVGIRDLATNNSASLGPAIVAQRVKPVVIRMQNDLRRSTFFSSVDTSSLERNPAFHRTGLRSPSKAAGSLDLRLRPFLCSRRPEWPV